MFYTTHLGYNNARSCIRFKLSQKNFNLGDKVEEVEAEGDKSSFEVCDNGNSADLDFNSANFDSDEQVECDNGDSTIGAERICILDPESEVIQNFPVNFLSA